MVSSGAQVAALLIPAAVLAASILNRNECLRIEAATIGLGDALTTIRELR